MATSEATVPVEEHYQKRCTYCFQELSEMTDPRLLPCQHIVCLTCLENDWKLDELQCRACGKAVTTASIDVLPQVRIADELDGDLAKDGGSHICSVAGDGGDGKEATAYCTDCGKLMCKEHDEMHGQFHGDDHKVISIDVYATKPGFFKVERCKTHKSKPVAVACQSCDQLFCMSCALDDCSKGGKHETIPLATSRINLEAQFADMMKKCSDKVTELCKLEKQTWQTVDTLNEKCAALLNQVDMTAEKQVSEIEKRAAELKQEITDYQSDRLKRVEDYITDLVRKADDLEEVQVLMKMFLKENNTATIVTERQTKQNELLQAQSLDTTTNFDCEEKSLVENGVILCFKDVEQYALQGLSPSSIVYQKSLKLVSGAACYSIDIDKLGTITFGCGNSLLTYTSDLQYTHTTTSTYHVCSVARQQNNNLVYYLNSDKRIGKVSLNSPVAVPELFVTPSSTDTSRIAANNNLLVVSNSAAGVHLQVFDFNARLRGNYLLPQPLRTLKFGPNGDLVTLDIEGKVCTYRISNTEEPKLLWECTAITGAYALCMDQRRGLVYVTGKGQMLYIISEGRIAGRLKSTCLPNMDGASSKSTDIALHGDLLLTTQNASNSVKIFKLNW